MQRQLNEIRHRGAICHRAAGLSVGAPLQWSAPLAAVAQAQAQDMARLEQMGHLDGQHRGLAERLGALGYRFRAAVENVAVGYVSLDAVVEAWIDSEGHCDNLMNTTVLEFGLACSDGAAGGGAGRYWTLVLGAPSRPR
ncbi:MAG: CAP domain-containing protein [Caldimonas sp.]